MRQICVARFLVGGLFSLGVILAAPEVSALPKQGGAASCDCYFFFDCPEEEIATCTGFGACSPNGKLDGTCLLIPTGEPAPPELLAEAMGLYFEAYLVAISSGEGRPSDEILADAQAVKLNETLHNKARNAVHDALDAVIGFDFQFPQAPGNSANPGQAIGPASFGNIRGTPNGAAAIAEAARTGMAEAILTRNLNAVTGPLEAFWAAHPDFRPNHTGRFYPHGHADYDQEVGTPLAGQVDALQRILLHLLSDGAPLCGNDVREDTEACDGTDDSACPAVCTTDCTCGFVP